MIERFKKVILIALINYNVFMLTGLINQREDTFVFGARVTKPICIDLDVHGTRTKIKTRLSFL